jgi:hypothetical protein
VGLRTGLDRCGKSRPHRDSIPGLSRFQDIAPQYIPMNMCRKLEVGLCFSNKTLGTFCVPVFPCSKCKFLNVWCVSTHPITANYEGAIQSQLN